MGGERGNGSAGTRIQIERYEDTQVVREVEGGREKGKGGRGRVVVRG